MEEAEFVWEVWEEEEKQKREGGEEGGGECVQRQTLFDVGTQSMLSLSSLSKVAGITG